jgi:Flp pilus assembly protein TadG
MTRTMFRLLGCDRGTIAVIFAFALLPLLLSVGVATDAARAYMVRTKLSYALDAAGLAVGSSSGSIAQLTAIGQKFFDANFPPGGVGIATAFGVTVDGDKITVSATARVDTVFMQIAGKDHIDVSTSAEITRSIRGLELAMVLDNTGSMTSNNNIGAARDAANEMADILFGNFTVHPHLRVAVVPYSASVNVGSVAPTLVAAGSAYNPGSASGWKGCVVERAGADAVADTNGVLWTRYIWATATDNSYTLADPSTIKSSPSYGNGGTGPNLGCPTPITPLTDTKSTVTAAIDAMEAWSRGGTFSDIGMAWGLRVLSPAPPFTEGLPWGTNDWTKAVILMTDGDNQFYKLTSTTGANHVNSGVISDYTGYGRLDDLGRMGTTNTTTAKSVINSRMTAVCNAMKAKQIVIYTVTFTSGINAATKELYRTCASDPSKYFDSPSQSDLKQAFRKIANELSNLRVSK